MAFDFFDPAMIAVEQPWPLAPDAAEIGTLAIIASPSSEPAGNVLWNDLASNDAALIDD